MAAGKSPVPARGPHGACTVEVASTLNAHSPAAALPCRRYPRLSSLYGRQLLGSLVDANAALTPYFKPRRSRFKPCKSPDGQDSKGSVSVTRLACINALARSRQGVHAATLCYTATAFMHRRLLTVRDFAKHKPRPSRFWGNHEPFVVSYLKSHPAPCGKSRNGFDFWSA